MIPIVLALVGVAFASILPTAVYLYVERRGRRNWVDAQAKRARAPLGVHLAAWSGLLVGQLAVPWLLVAGECALVWLGLAKIGRASMSLTVAIAALALAVVAQSIAALRLFPLSVRLLANDTKRAARARSVAGGLAVANLFGLASSGFGYAVLGAMRSGHPIDRVTKATLTYGVILPVAAFAVLGLVEALLVASAGRAKS